MAANQKTIFVYDDFSTDQPILMGKLYVNVIKGGESYSFEYDKDWLERTGLALTLDPELMPYSGRQYPTGKNIFGLFADASPDRWGRVLISAKESLQRRKAVSLPSFMTVIIFWAYMMKPEWAEFDSSWILRVRFFLMIRKLQRLPGLHFVHWRRPQGTLKMMKQVYPKNG